MAIELLDKANTRHEVHHDLESFYWLLTWITLRYTAHNHDDGALACHKLFDVDNPAALKRNWLIGDSPLDNEASPLYILAEAMRQLTQQQPRIQKQKRITFSFVRDPPKIDAVPLTYALIELAFKAVVEHPSWENFEDAPGALPFKVPSKTYNVVGKAKTETRDRELRRSALINSQPGRDTSGGPSMRCRTKKRRREEEDPSGHATESTITLPFERSSGERSQLANKKSKIQPVKIIHRMKGRRPGRNNR
jgi:hypothetical protein